MSVLLAVVSAVAPVAPVVHATAPEAVKTVVQTVQVTPEQVTALLQLILLVSSGMVASVAHALLEKGRLPFGLNYFILFLYSFGIAGLDLFLKGSLSFNNLPALGVAFLTVFAAAQIRYNTSKVLANVVAPKAVEAVVL